MSRHRTLIRLQYVTVQDTDQNMDGNTAETFTLLVDFNAAAGSDYNTLTLTETSVSSGIFRTSGIVMTANTVAYPQNGAYELLASGIGTTTYVDPGYSADTASGYRNSNLQRRSGERGDNRKHGGRWWRRILVYDSSRCSDDYNGGGDGQGEYRYSFGQLRFKRSDRWYITSLS